MKHRQLDFDVGHNATRAEAVIAAEDKLTLAEALDQFYYGSMDGVQRAVIPAEYLTHAGSYDLIIRACQGLDCGWAGASLIRDSPRRLVVSAAEPDPVRSYAVELSNPGLYLNEGQGWLAGFTETNIPSFSIQVRDKFGNNKEVDFYDAQQLKIEVVVKGQSNGLQFQQVYDGTGKDLGDGEFLLAQDFEGKFLVQLRGKLAQHLDIAVRFNRVDITNSPAVAQVRFPCSRVRLTTWPLSLTLNPQPNPHANALRIGRPALLGLVGFHLSPAPRHADAAQTSPPD